MKILLIGQPGSGKSTLTQKISAKKPLLPVLYLDRLWHTTNYDEQAKIWFKNQQLAFMREHDSWLIDGNYQSTMAERLEQADTILWLKTSRLQGVYRAIKRSAKRKFFHQERKDMAAEFEEKWDKEFLAFLICIWQFKDQGEKKIAELLKTYPDKKVIILRNAKEKKAWLETLQ